MQEKLNGVILAGGKSSRMGSEKGVIEVNGEKMIITLCRLLKPLVSNILIITSNSDYQFLGYPLYADLILDSGPAGGIFTGLSCSSTDKNLILPCDTPFLTTDFLHYLIEESGHAEITVPVYKSRIHPLCGVYSKTFLPEWEKRVRNGELKLVELLKHFQVKYLDIDLIPEFDGGRLFRNINCPEDLAGDMN
jgi:molybdopterin-guanine dinucleotide biosynthesis protein A